MTESNEELITKIEDMRKEMDSIHRSVSSLRYDSMSSAFRKQIGGSFLDINREAFRNAMGPRDDLSSQSLEMLSLLSAMYDDAIRSYENEDPNGGMARLDELSELISGTSVRVLGNDHVKALTNAVNRAKEQMALMETLRFQVGRPMLRRSCESVFGSIEPEDIEAQLTPLSNAIRLKIMALLYTSARSFTEIGKELDMQKGHLQFHMRKLTEAGYVKVDPRTHLYSIEEKGYLLIEGLGRLFTRLD